MGLFTFSHGLGRKEDIKALCLVLAFPFIQGHGPRKAKGERPQGRTTHRGLKASRKPVQRTFLKPYHLPGPVPEPSL